MITAALHSDFPVSRIVRTLADLLARYVLAMNYGLAATLLKAVEDFLRGPEVVTDAGWVGAGEAHWWHIALFDRVAVTDAGQGGVRVRRRDPEALRTLSREGAR